MGLMPKKSRLKARWTEKKAALREKNTNLAHPVVRASYIWSIVSEQLGDILGPQVHHQWFRNVRPTVISNNVLILEVSNHFQAQWIHTHYHELTDVLLSVLDKKLSSFFVSQSERDPLHVMGPKLLPECSASEIKRHSEYDEGND
jgi:chromosomal replication initiation ATPase DnaA